MERNKQTKIMVIVSLCVAVLCLTLGFAAFSNTLTISSSATVTPDASDFKMVAYGIDPNSDVIFQDFSSFRFDSSVYTSLTTTKPLVNTESDVYCLQPTIVSTLNSIKISNISVNFKNTGVNTYHAFMIKNEGKYAAYLTDEDSKFNNVLNRTCTASDNATPSLVEAACADIFARVNLYESSGGPVRFDNGAYLIEPGDYVIIIFQIGYSLMSNMADGEFEAKFDELTLKFSTVA